MLVGRTNAIHAPPSATGWYFDGSRDCEPPSATAPLMCLSMALPLVCVAPAVVQQDKSNPAAIAPAVTRGPRTTEG